MSSIHVQLPLTPEEQNTITDNSIKLLNSMDTDTLIRVDGELVYVGCAKYNHPDPPETMVVEIPRIAEHGGYEGNLIKVEIPRVCPLCGGPRATRVWRGLSYDGSRRLSVDCWENECGHIDDYISVVAEGKRVSYSTPTITDTTDI